MTRWSSCTSICTVLSFAKFLSHCFTHLLSATMFSCKLLDDTLVSSFTTSFPLPPFALFLLLLLRSTLYTFSFLHLYSARPACRYEAETPVTLRWNERVWEKERERERKQTCLSTPSVSTLCVVFPRKRKAENSAKEETGKRCRRGRWIVSPLPSFKSARSIFVGFRSTFKADGRGEGVLACNNEEKKNP